MVPEYVTKGSGLAVERIRERRLTIFWDWNGTLLADVELVVRINHDLFTARGYPDMDAERYRALFTFPVKDFYLAAGVPEADFEAVAKEWYGMYVARCPGCPLRFDAAATVRRFRERGFRQVIVSASRQDTLDAQVSAYPELTGMFEAVRGLSDHYAVSKAALAQRYLRETGCDPADAVFLGDTRHDAEVARAAGARCVLISGGHQSDEVLRTCGVPVAPSLTAAADALLSNTL